MVSRYKWFPPVTGHIRVPTSSRRAAHAGLALYAPCRRRAIWMQRAAWSAVSIVGPGALPGGSGPFIPPDPEVWQTVVDELIEGLGRFDELAIVGRPQSARSGFSVLLLADDEPMAFVRVRPGLDPKGDPEVVCLEILRENRPTGFLVPDVRLTGQVGPWGYVAVSPFPATMHRPAREAPLEEILEEVGDRLKVLPRGEEVPHGWTPIHGDFTPWNLRRLAEGRFVLFDWERAGWGPASADLVLYEAAEVALGWRRRFSHPDAEAVRFWRSGAGGVIDDPKLLEALDRAAASF